LSVLPGNFNQDDELTRVDIDLLSSEALAGNHSAVFDLNEDQFVNQQDRQTWVEDLVGTRFGDADLNGVVQFSDFLALSSNFSQRGGWAEGDFDGSGGIQFPDFLLLSANFGRVGTETQTVPEPNALVTVVACVAMLTYSRHSRIRSATRVHQS
jgi:hypothetical protein